MVNALIFAALLLAGLTGGQRAEAGPADTSRHPHPCELQLEVQADRLSGTFACNGLVTDDGAAAIDLADGRF